MESIIKKFVVQEKKNELMFKIELGLAALVALLVAVSLVIINNKMV